MHYYLFDWCYSANVMLMISLKCLPLNITVIKVRHIHSVEARMHNFHAACSMHLCEPSQTTSQACFAFSLGPLAWSILTFRNSLVYHSVEKVTTLFLHLYPACVMWATRWYPGAEVQAARARHPAYAAAWEEAGGLQLVALPMVPYLLWGVLYYIKVRWKPLERSVERSSPTQIFVVSSDRIRERGYHTLFKYVTSKPSFYGRIISAAPEALQVCMTMGASCCCHNPPQPLVYMSFHLAMTMLTMALCTLWWSNYWASSAFIVAMFVVAAVNGANYYFDVRCWAPKDACLMPPRSLLDATSATLAWARPHPHALEPPRPPARKQTSILPCSLVCNTTFVVVITARVSVLCACRPPQPRHPPGARQRGQCAIDTAAHGVHASCMQRCEHGGTAPVARAATAGVCHDQQRQHKRGQKGDAQCHKRCCSLV